MFARLCQALGASVETACDLLIISDSDFSLFAAVVATLLPTTPHFGAEMAVRITGGSGAFSRMKIQVLKHTCMFSSLVLLAVRATWL